MNCHQIKIFSVLITSLITTSALAKTDRFELSKEAVKICAPKMKFHALELAQKLGPHFDFSKNLNRDLIMNQSKIDEIIKNSPRDLNFVALSVQDVNQNTKVYNEALGDECVLLSFPSPGYTVQCMSSVWDKRKKSWEIDIPLMILNYQYDPTTRNCAPKKALFPSDGYKAYLEIPHLNFLKDGKIESLKKHVNYTSTRNFMVYYENWKKRNLQTWLKESRKAPIYNLKPRNNSWQKSIFVGKKFELTYDFFHMSQKDERLVQGPYDRIAGCSPRRNLTPGTYCNSTTASGYLSPRKSNSAFLIERNGPEQFSFFEQYFLTLVTGSDFWRGDYPIDVVNQAAIDRANLHYSMRTVTDDIVKEEHRDFIAELNSYVSSNVDLYPEDALNQQEELRFFNLPKGTILEVVEIEVGEPVELFGSPFLHESEKKHIVRTVKIKFQTNSGERFFYRTNSYKYQYQDTEIFLPLVFESI